MQAYVLTFAFLWVSVALQGAWPTWLRLGGQPPDLLVAFIACVGLVRGTVDGCAAGLIGAVLLAGAHHIPIGGLLVAFMTVGAVAGLLRGSLFAERLVVGVLVAVLGVVVSAFVRMVFMPPPEGLVWLRGVFWSAVLTGLVTPPIFWLTRLIQAREPL